MRPRTQPRELSDLKNLGSTIVERLGEIGVHSEADLRRVGPAKAYLLMQARAKTRLPVCYYLYSLAGALQEKHWNDLSKEEKKALLGEIARED